MQMINEKHSAWPEELLRLRASCACCGFRAAPIGRYCAIRRQRGTFLELKQFMETQFAFSAFSTSSGIFSY